MERIKKHIGWHYLDDPRHLFFVIAIVVGGVFGFRYSLFAYPDIFRTDVHVKNSLSVRPEESIVFEFSQPVLRESYEKNISIHPEKEVNFSWEESGKKLVLSPRTPWDMEEDYSINFPEGKSVMLTRVEPIKAEFSTLRYPEIREVFPKDGSENVIFDLENPLRVSFSSETTDFSLDFSLEPQKKLIVQNDIQKTNFKIIPEEKLEEGVKYTFSIKAKYKGNEKANYQELSKTSFETLPPPPETWEKDLGLRVEQAKKYTRPKNGDGKYIDINLESQVLSMFENGKVLDSFIISSGKRGMDTPKGEFKILAKRPRPWSKKYALYMPWFMGFTREGHGIHELPEWPGGYKEGASHLGIPVSHGCVRLGIGPAKTLYEWAEVGTPIVVY